jgi:hypothetical protein
MRLFRFDRRWFALFALFSLGSLLAIPTGNWVWLTCLTYLTYLAYLIPAPAPPDSETSISPDPGKKARRTPLSLPTSVRGPS